MENLFDVAIVGGGPAGLSAALVLGRARRGVVLCDHGRPRNYAAQAVHGYLGLDGLTPAEIRDRGRRECAAYGVKLLDVEVTGASREESNGRTRFRIELAHGEVLHARKLLLASGVRDELPAVAGIDSFYGVSVHHCPYCDGWEHRGKRLVAFSQKPASAASLAIMLRAWSEQVTCATHGNALDAAERERLGRAGVKCREEEVAALEGEGGKLRGIRFADGSFLECDAMFFSAGQKVQCAEISKALGCDCDERNQLVAEGKQGSGVRGLFLAGDADGDVQFAVVAAAEGAIAATAINAELQEEDFG